MSLNLPPLPPKREEDKEIVPDYMYDAKQIEELFIGNTTRIFGVPGASLTYGINGHRNTDVMIAGKEGENAIAKILNKLVEENPDLYVFHSLRWPESNGDTDHILVYKEMIIIVDSKRWKGSRKYSVSHRGEILRGTVAFPEGKVKMAGAMGVWRRKLPKITVKGIIAIAQEKVYVVRDKNWYKAAFRLVEEEKLEAEVKNQIAHHRIVADYHGNLNTLKTLASFLVKPRDPRAGLIQGTTENPFQ